MLLAFQAALFGAQRRCIAALQPPEEHQDVVSRHTIARIPVCRRSTLTLTTQLDISSAMCYIEPATPRRYKCGRTELDPLEDTPRMCIQAENRGTWCEPPFERASKASSHARKLVCREYRRKKQDPKPTGGDDGPSAGGATSAVSPMPEGMKAGA